MLYLLSPEEELYLYTTAYLTKNRVSRMPLFWGHTGSHDPLLCALSTDINYLPRLMHGQEGRDYTCNKIYLKARKIAFGSPQDS